jgi:hypothetical protein
MVYLKNLKKDGETYQRKHTIGIIFINKHKTL